MTLTFYYTLASAPCRIVLLTLKNLGLEYESKVLNMQAGENKSDEYLKINPQGTVPVVVDDDFAMNESRAICCYLVNEKSPGSTLYPAGDTKARYVVDQRLFYDASTFTPALTAAIVPVIKKGVTVIEQDRKDRIFSLLKTLDSFLDGYEWFSASENVSIADLSILANFATLYHIGLDMTNFPNLAAWYERCKELPGAEENEKGAKLFASFVKNKLTEPF